MKPLARPIPRILLPALCLFELGATILAGGEQPSRSSTPSSALYKTSEIEGWTVYIKKDLLKSHPALAERTLALLRAQLFQITRIVPARAVKKLQTVCIWVEENDPSTPCMAYHPGVFGCVSTAPTPRWPAASSWPTPATFSTGLSSNRGWSFTKWLTLFTTSS